MFWILIIALGIAWVGQSILSFKQSQAFARLFVSLRRRGRVSIGKFRGGIARGSIVMFVLDDDGIVVEGHRLSGVTVLARFRPFDLYQGVSVADLDPQVAVRHGKSVMKAVLNARDNYLTISGGQEAPEPPSALSRTLSQVSGVTSRWRRKPVASTN